ncbi:MAG: hypothetical protein RIT45_2350 [Pseudomonadota bacterium]|jgi:serine/threonine-protein kinase
MKRCPGCRLVAPLRAEICPQDGTPLTWEVAPRLLSAHNPEDPPPGVGQTIVGPPPLPPKGEKPAAEAPHERAQTLMYARSQVEGAIPVAAAPRLEPNDDQPPPGPVRSKVRETMRQSAGVAGSKPTADDARTTAQEAPDDLTERPTLVTSMEGDLDPEIEAERSAYVGKLIDDRYLVKSLIGRGGMGAVYRVEQIHLRKDMAIKLLHENLVARKQLVSRFTREARAISRLSSPHTVMVYDFGRWGEVFYLVMELLEGEPLDEVLADVGPMTPERTTAILLQMCDSLQEAHEHGIVHRDLKPENIMLLSGGPHPDFVKILDFGLAKVEDVDDPYTIHSQKDIFGTPFYMSPEQIRAGEVDGRSDLYAVGALAFRMLTGKQVFGHERSTFDILKAHLMEPPPLMSDAAPELSIPASLETIVQKALEKDPDKRWGSMKELAEALVEARKSGFTGGTKPKRRKSESPGDAALAAAPTPYAAEDAGSAAETRLALDDEALGRHVRRGRFARGALFGAISLAIVGAIAATVVGLGSKGVGQDQEPNDMPAQATPVDASGNARGTIGERRSQEAGDRDCYRLPNGKDDDLSIEVTPVPNMDLELRLHDGDGRSLGVFDHAGPGQGEVVRHLDTRRAPTVVCIGEKLSPGQVAGESLSDSYQLHVRRRPRVGPMEQEPNEEAGADALPGGLSLVGALDGPRDIDVFRLDERLDGKVLRVVVESKDQRPLGGLRLALLDAGGKVLATEVLRGAAQQGEVAFAGSDRQQPDRVALSWIGDAATRWRPEEKRTGAYTIWYRVDSLADQAEKEPNNTAASATPMVVGAWHVGDAGDAAGVDWLRVEGGDEALRRIRVEAGAPAGSGFLLTLHDPVGKADLRQLRVDEASNDLDFTVDGRGAGFLLRVEKLPPEGSRRKPKRLAARYRLRVRWAQQGNELPKLEIP